MNAITEKSNDFINQSLSGLSSNYDDFTLKQKELSDSFNNTIENMITSNAERIKKLDEELGNELTKSLESLGSSLATLSSKFANDYGPITENLKKIIESTNIK